MRRKRREYQKTQQVFEHFVGRKSLEGALQRMGKTERKRYSAYFPLPKFLTKNYAPHAARRRQNNNLCIKATTC
jgi:hypothetical protein